MCDEQLVKIINDELVDRIESYIDRSVTYTEIEKYNNILILCTGVLSKVQNLVQYITRYNDKADIYIAGSKETIDNIIVSNDKKIYGYAMEGKFNDSLVDRLKENFNGIQFDLIMYICKYAIDVRDLNIIEIGGIISKEYGSKMISFTSGEELNLYKNIDRYQNDLLFYDKFIQWINSCVI